MPVSLYPREVTNTSYVWLYEFTEVKMNVWFCMCVHLQVIHLLLACFMAQSGSLGLICYSQWQRSRLSDLRFEQAAWLCPLCALHPRRLQCAAVCILLSFLVTRGHRSHIIDKFLA